MSGSTRITRRAALGRLGLLLAAAGGAGCTPLRILLKAYPERFGDDARMTERMLRAFTTTVIPGAQEDEESLVRVYFDEYYPFARYAAFFASDLCARAGRLCGESRFDRLSAADRTRVIQDGLKGDGATRRLYGGAIFLAQLSFYGGIYDSQKGCALIDFDGAYRMRPPWENFYPDPDAFLARPATRDGNFV